MRNVQKANTVASMAATFVVLVWGTKHVTTILDSAGRKPTQKSSKTARVDTPGNYVTSQYALATVALDSALVPTNALAQNF